MAGLAGGKLHCLLFFCSSGSSSSSIIIHSQNANLLNDKQVDFFFYYYLPCYVSGTLESELFFVDKNALMSGLLSILPPVLMCESTVKSQRSRMPRSFSFLFL